MITSKMRNSLFLMKAIGVFLLAYNPDWKSWIEEHSWCATIIEVDEEAHIVGSINFYTAQTGI